MDFIQSYLIIIVEMSCFFLFHDIFSKSISTFRNGFNFIWIIVMSAVMFVISYLFDSHFIIKEFAIILCLSIGSNILKKRSLKFSLFVSVLFMFLLVIADFITIAINTQILSVDKSNGIFLEMLAVLMSKAVLLLLVVIIKQLCDGKWGNADDELDGMRFVAFPFSSICMIAVLLSNGFGIQEKADSYSVWCIIFSLIAMNILMIFYMRDATEKNYLLQEKRMFEMDARSQQLLYRSLEEKIELQRCISHDYKNHLTYIQALLERKDYDSISDYLKKINGEVEHNLDMIDTNNPIINTIINTKYYEAKNSGAVIVCKINNLDKVKIEETDIILLLSNLLNNAIEAIEKCVKEKILRFKIVLENGNLIISVQNSYEGILKKNGEIYITTKKRDKELHGIGMKNIIRITNKYQGMYKFEALEKEFHAVVIIPINETPVN